MSRKIGKILRDAFWVRQKGLAQIPLMIALLLMAVAIPVVTELVQQQQDIRNRAATDPYATNCEDCVNVCNNQECIGHNGASCGSGSKCGAENGCPPCGSCEECNKSQATRCNNVGCIGTEGNQCGMGDLDCSGQTFCGGSSTPCGPNTQWTCSPAGTCCSNTDCSCMCQGLQDIPGTENDPYGQCTRGCTSNPTNTLQPTPTLTPIPTAPECPPGESKCTPGAVTSCSGNTREECDSDGCGSHWAGCYQADSICNPETGNCEAPSTVCDPGSARCGGSNSVEICKDDGSGWTVKSCGSDEYCDPTIGAACISGYQNCGNGGFCTRECDTTTGNLLPISGNCGMGGFHCCKNVGLGTCGDPPDKGKCKEVDGVIQCVGGTGTCQGPEVCKSPGSCVPRSLCKGSSIVGLCNGGADYLCCTGTVSCDPGSHKCDGGKESTCQADGTWGIPLECPSGQCFGDYCKPGNCINGTKRCNVDVIETCIAAEWERGSTCPDGCIEVDGVPQCRVNECGEVGKTRCEGNVLQTCQVDGQWSDGTDCGERGCVEIGLPPIAQCNIKVCEPGDLICVDGIESTCNSAGTQYEGEIHCPYGCKSDGKACNECDSTFPKQCNGNQVVECIGGVMTPTNCVSPDPEVPNSCYSCVGSGVCQQTLFGGVCPELAPTLTPTATPTPGGGGGPTSGPTSTPVPLACNCRDSRTAKIEKADANCDGKTDVLDISIWRSESKDQGGPSTSKATWLADFNCDGVVNDDDRDKWLEIYTNSLPFATI